MPTSPTAVIFDLDDTLVEDVAAAHASFEEVGRALLGDRFEHSGDGGTMQDAARAIWRSGPDFALCTELGLASREGLWASFDGNHPRLDGLRAWISTFRTEAWTAVLATLGIHDADLIPTAQEAFAAAQLRGHVPIQGAATAVQVAGHGRRLGLLTNGPSDVQRLKLEGSGLTSRFEAVAVSGEMGVGKPSPAAFDNILQRLEVEPREAVMVGDDWKRDVEGAVFVGLPVVWIASGRPVPAQLPGVTVIDTIEELEAALG